VRCLFGVRNGLLFPRWPYRDLKGIFRHIDTDKHVLFFWFTMLLRAPFLAECGICVQSLATVGVQGNVGVATHATSRAHTAQGVIGLPHPLRITLYQTGVCLHLMLCKIQGVLLVRRSRADAHRKRVPGSYMNEGDLHQPCGSSGKL